LKTKEKEKYTGNINKVLLSSRKCVLNTSKVSTVFLKERTFSSRNFAYPV